MQTPKIEFAECLKSGYPARTYQNAAHARLTIAIAKDFMTPGEKLTKNAVLKAQRIYAPVPYDYITKSNLAYYIQQTVLYKDTLPEEIKTINIAGNGSYSIQEDQEKIDRKVYNFLSFLFDYCKFEPELIRSGGQTGIDEAGLKAASKLGINALCLAPKGWMFRDISGKDISDEHLFKERFKDYI